MKKKLYFYFLISILIAFILGFITNNYYHQMKFQSRRINKKVIKFWESKKAENNIPLTNEEQSAIKLFKTNYDKCIDQNLNLDEKKILSEIESKVKTFSDSSKRIEINYEDLDLTDEKNIADIIKKVRKCKFSSKKIIKDKKILKSAISKMKLNDIITLNHGI